MGKTNNVIIPEERMARYIQYCEQQRKKEGTPTRCVCPNCNKLVEDGPLYPYFYDKENNDIHFASVCPECGGLMICKE